MVEKKTRWQLRVNHGLENRIRDLAEKEHRSINQTVTYIIEKYFEIADREEKDREVTDPQLEGSG